MAFKFVALFALVAVASAGLLPVQQYSNHGDQYENHSPAQYDFQYSVHDEHTGDIKSQQESRQGDVVHGQYSLIEADGHSRRVVDYTADAHNGFNAQVRTEKLGHEVHQIAQHSAPIIAHAPVAQVYQHAAPVAIAHHAAPAVHYQQAQVYQHAAPVAIAHHAAPIAIAHHAAPAVHYQQANVYQHAAPVAIAHHAAPAVHYQQAQVYQHAAPAVHYSGSVGHSSQSISLNHNDNHYNNYHH